MVWAALALLSVVPCFVPGLVPLHVGFSCLPLVPGQGEGGGPGAPGCPGGQGAAGGGCGAASRAQPGAVAADLLGDLGCHHLGGGRVGREETEHGEATLWIIGSRLTLGLVLTRVWHT